MNHVKRRVNGAMLSEEAWPESINGNGGKLHRGGIYRKWGPITITDLAFLACKVTQAANHTLVIRL